MSSSQQYLQQLSNTLFWDVDRESLDTQAHAAFIIVRAMERGTRDEALATRNFYDDETLKESLLNAPVLADETISFFANQFDLPRSAFRAYGRAGHWAS